MHFESKFDIAKIYPQQDENLFEYWLSMSPVAPLFGVPWRFAELSVIETDLAPQMAQVFPVIPTASVDDDTVSAEIEQAAVEDADVVPDDLTEIKGVGPKMATALVEAGVTQLSQIAAWTEADVSSWSARLGGVPGRIQRDDWVGQAKILSQPR